MKDHISPIRSALPGVAWPAVPGQEVASLLALQYQLAQTQWWTAAELERQQLLQLEHSFRHAYENVPFHRERLAGAGYDPGRSLTREVFLALPLLTRAEIQALGDALLSRGVPAGHGQMTVGETSGSTGTPIRFYGTELTQFFWHACTLRDHLWHRRDASGKLAAIRKNMKDAIQPSWGSPTDPPPTSTSNSTGCSATRPTIC